MRPAPPVPSRATEGVANPFESQEYEASVYSRPSTATSSSNTTRVSRQRPFANFMSPN